MGIFGDVDSPTDLTLMFSWWCARRLHKVVVSVQKFRKMLIVEGEKCMVGRRWRSCVGDGILPRKTTWVNLTQNLTFSVDGIWLWALIILDFWQRFSDFPRAKVCVVVHWVFLNLFLSFFQRIKLIIRKNLIFWRSGLRGGVGCRVRAISRGFLKWEKLNVRRSKGECGKKMNFG